VWDTFRTGNSVVIRSGDEWILYRCTGNGITDQTGWRVVNVTYIDKTTAFSVTDEVSYDVDLLGIGSGDSYLGGEPITIVDSLANRYDLTYDSATTTWRFRKHFWSTNADPAVTDDKDSQYLEGSKWYNYVTGVLFISIDDATGAAVWLPLIEEAGTSTGLGQWWVGHTQDPTANGEADSDGTDSDYENITSFDICDNNTTPTDKSTELLAMANGDLLKWDNGEGYIVVYQLDATPVDNTTHVTVSVVYVETQGGAPSNWTTPQNNDLIHVTGETAGLGDVVGPSSATANALARFDTTTGKLIKDSATATLTDSTFMSLIGSSPAVQMKERSTGPSSVTARGTFWVKDDAPSTPQFTDDDSGEHRLGDVVGPSSATANGVGIYSGSTGKLLKSESGLVYDTTLAELVLDSATAAAKVKERAAAPAGQAGYGKFWVKSDAPSTPWFTDDGSNDHRLGKQTCTFHNSGRATGIATTWITTDQQSLWSIVNHVDNMGTATDPAMGTNLNNWSGFLVPKAGTVTDIYLQYGHTAGTLDGQLGIFKFTTTEGSATGNPTGVILGSKQTLTGGVAWATYKLSQTGLSTSVAAGDILLVCYKSVAFTGSVLWNVSTLIEFD